MISRTSTQRYKSSPENIPEIARQLGVAHILEGSVQKAGDEVRVNVQLIEAESDRHIWAEVYDRKLTDIFVVQSDIAGNIARALHARLSPREQRALAAPPTNNPAAYEAYLRGLALWNTLTSSAEVLRQAAEHFARAAELDPNFTQAWSRLAVAYTMIYAEVDATPAVAARAKEALERAQRLDADIGDVHFAEGLYRYRVLRDFPRALESFERARQQRANELEAVEFTAYVKRRQGKWDEAIRLHALSLELDPRNPVILSEAAVTYRAVRRFDELERLLDRVLEIEPGNDHVLAQKAEVALAQGNPEAAGRLLESIKTDAQQPVTVGARFNYYLLTRQFPAAIGMLRQLLAGDPPPQIAPHLRTRLAIAEAFAGNASAAQEEFTRARDQLLALRGAGDTGQNITNSLLLASAFLKDKAAVEREVAALSDEIATDALIGPLLEITIAAARTQLGEHDAAITILSGLLKKPGEDALTPALLRLDPRWDPLRGDPRFQKLVEGKSP